MRLLAALEAVDALPAHADTRARFLAYAGSAGASPTALASIAESDPALVARLLRLANRVANPAGKLVGTTAAIEVLGRDRARTAVARLPHYSLLDGQSEWEDEVDRFRMHAVAVRAVATTLARELGDPNPDRVAATALLHDIGKLVLARAHRGYRESLAPAGAPDDRAAAERAALGVDHAAVGGLVARRWGLPKILATSIQSHHAEGGRGDSTIVRLADLFVHRTNGTRVPLDRLLDAASEARLPHSKLASMLAQPGSVEGVAPTERCPLTARQLELIRALANGKQYKEIAGELGLSHSTIRSHLHAAYRRLGVVDRAQAVLLAAERGWIRGLHISAAGTR